MAKTKEPVEQQQDTQRLVTKPMNQVTQGVLVDALCRRFNRAATEYVTAEQDLQSCGNRLRSAAAGLAEDLSRLVKRFDEEGFETSSVNSLGEVQTQGHEIDRLCCELAHLRGRLQNRHGKVCAARDVLGLALVPVDDERVKGFASVLEDLED